MQFILTGFTQDMGVRVFAFEGVDADRARTAFIVRADLALTRRYGIKMQELPLLCRSFLERRHEGGDAIGVLTFSEQEMSICASNRAAAKDGAGHKRTAPRRPSGGNPGSAWRTPLPH